MTGNGDARARSNRQRANHHLLGAIEQLWELFPDMRFGQLLMNLSRIESGFADTWEWTHSDWRECIEQAWVTWGSSHAEDDTA